MPIQSQREQSHLNQTKNLNKHKIKSIHKTRTSLEIQTQQQVFTTN